MNRHIETGLGRRAAACALTIAAALGSLLGCEDQTAPPAAAPAPAAGSGGGSMQQQAGSNGALSRLSENPKSLYGRSAKTAKDVVAQAENKQAEAVGMAQEMSGEGSPLELAGLVWTAPAAWERVTPSNAMRKFELHVNSENGEAAAVVTFSSGIGGTPEQNIDRWAAQLLVDGSPAIPMVKHRKVSDVTVTLTEMEGTYKEGMQPAGGGQPVERPDYMLRGAIVEGPQGTVFIKMVGPKSVVDLAGNDWTMMIDGMRKKQR